MRKLLPLVIAVLVVAGCGDEKKAAAPTPAATQDPLAGYSEGVKSYYAGANPEAADDPNADAEVKYFQPPMPAEVGIGETITLTGTNIGVKMRVTVTGVERVGDHVAVNLALENDGITVYDAPLENAAVTYADGKPQGVAKGAQADCSNGFDKIPRVDVSAKASGCLLFPASGTATPDRFQLALETVPVEAGGIWNLN